MHKPLSWWSKNLNTLWKAKLPLKQRLFWRCITGTLPVGATLVKRKIATAIATCLWCHASAETAPHLLWSSHFSKILTQKISRFLSLRFPNTRFGKLFWLFGRCPISLRPYSLLLHWIRYWSLWTFGTDHNMVYMQKQLNQPYEFFRASLWQSVYDAYKEGDLDRSCLEIVYLCFWLRLSTFRSLSLYYIEHIIQATGITKKKCIHM